MNKIIEVCRINNNIDSKEVNEIKRWFRSLDKRNQNFVRVVGNELYTNVDNYFYSYITK